MGLRLNIYLNKYYEKMFKEIKEYLENRDGLEYNRTDIVRMAIRTLYEKIEKEKEEEEL